MLLQFKELGKLLQLYNVFVSYLKNIHNLTIIQFLLLGDDFTKVLNCLEEENVFMTLCNRQHKSFKFDCGVLEKFTIKELEEKVKPNISQFHT